MTREKFYVYDALVQVPIYKWRQGEPKFRSPEHALSYLKLRPHSWDSRSPNYVKPPKPHNRVPFQKVPREKRYEARQRFDMLVAKWHSEHPGQKMTKGKRCSLLGNVVSYMLHGRKHLAQMQCGERFKQQARRFLKQVEIDTFRAQPLQKRVKRLI